MINIDLEFLKKQITGGMNRGVPVFFIVVFGTVISIMLIGSVNSPLDEKVAAWAISAGLALVCVVNCGIVPLVKNKQTSDELLPENIRVEKRVAEERYYTNDSYWVSFKGEDFGRRVSIQFYNREFAVGREFYIISHMKRKNGREKEIRIGIYAADKYTVDANLL